MRIFRIIRRSCYDTVVLPFVMKSKLKHFESEINDWNDAFRSIFRLRNSSRLENRREYQETLDLLIPIFKSKINSPDDVRNIVREQDRLGKIPDDDWGGQFPSEYATLSDLMPDVMARANELQVDVSDFTSLDDCLSAYEYAPAVFDHNRNVFVDDSPYHDRCKLVAIKLTKEQLLIASSAKELISVLISASHVLIKGYSEIRYYHSDKYKRMVELLKFETSKFTECRTFLSENPEIVDVCIAKMNEFKNYTFKKR